MAATLAMSDQWHDGKRLHVIGTITFTGNYPAAGDSLNFASIDVESAQAPGCIDVNIFGGYVSEFTAGVSAVDTANKLKIYKAANTELDAGAYPAALTATPSPFHAIFKLV